MPCPSEKEKKNYSVDEYYRVQQGLKAKKQLKPRSAKLPTVHDFQFFDQHQLMGLLMKKFNLETERRLLMKTYRELKLEEQKEQKRRDKEGLEPLTEFESANIEKTIQTLVLSDGELMDISRLESEGFPDWSRRDLKEFVTACERYGRDAKHDICDEVVALTGKMRDRVEEYYDVFWKRYKEIKEYGKFIDKIERGEKRLERNRAMKEALAKKCARYSNPMRDMTLSYPLNSREKGFTMDEDKFLVCLMNKNKNGYESDWNEIKDAIRKAWQFRFDWFMKSRTVAELQKRGEFLCRIIEKEHNELELKRKAQEKTQRKRQKDKTTTKTTKKAVTGTKRKTSSKKTKVKGKAKGTKRRKLK